MRKTPLAICVGMSILQAQVAVNAKCPANGATAAGLGDAAGPDLLTPLSGIIEFRAGIATITGQVSYLQEYIRTQCLR
jgi:prophage endopeptidase